MDRFIKVVIALVIIAVIIFGIGGCCYSFNDSTYTITVTDKERVNKGDDSKYLVYCDVVDGDKDIVFENTDNFLRGKFNSSNIQAHLKVGKTYEVTVVGFRFPIFSAYQNIISVKDIK